MLQNYLKITWRNLIQNKTLSFVNIFGLSLGIAFAILIGMWIQYETSYDTFHKNPWWSSKKGFQWMFFRNK